MGNAVRNLKGEIVRTADDEEKNWNFSSSTWLLIGGLLLFNTGCFVHPGILDSIFRLFDIRLWPWWYFVMLVVVLLFSIRWFFIRKNWDDYDDMQLEAARRFMRMAVVVTIVFGLTVLFHVTQWTGYFYDPLQQWLGYGVFSWRAVGAFFMIVIVTIPVLYCIKEWLVTFWAES